MRNTQNRNTTWAFTRAMVVALVIGLLGSLTPAFFNGTPSGAATAEPDTKCITALDAPLTILDTAATHTALRAKQVRDVQLPDSLKSASAVIAVVRAKAAIATAIQAGSGSTATLPVLTTDDASPHTGVATALLPVENGIIMLRSTKATANVIVKILATASTTSGCLHMMTGEPAIDTAHGVGGPGMASANDSLRARLVDTGRLPDSLHATLVSITLVGGSTPSEVDLVVDGQRVKTFPVASNRTVNALEVIPPTSNGDINLGVTSGAVDIVVTPIAWATDVSALNGETVRIASAGTTSPNPKGLRVLLPEKARDAGAILVAVNGVSRPDTRGSISVRPSDRVALGQATFTAPTGGGSVRQLAVVRPGTDGNIIVSVSGATNWSVDIVGWSTIVAPNVPADNVTVAPATQVSVISTNPNTSTPTVVDYAGADKLQPGDVLTSVPTQDGEDGLLVKVTSVIRTPAATPTALRAFATAVAEGSQLVEVEPAAVDDLIPSGSFDQLLPLDSVPDGEVTEPPALPPDTPPATPNPDGTPGDPQLSAPAAALRLRAASNTGGGIRNLARFQCSGSVAAEVSASVQLNGSVNMGASWWGPKTADFGFTGGISGELRGSVSGRASCNSSAVIDGPALPTLRFTIGGVPVWVVPKLKLNLRIHGSVEGAITARAGFNAQINAGVRYANGGFTPYRNASLSFPSSLDARASGNIEVEVAPRLDLRVYGVAGPYVELGAFASLNANTQANPWWKIEAGARMAVGLTFLNLHYDAPKVELFRRTVAQAGGPFPGPSGSPGSGGGGTVGSYFDRALSASGGRAPYTWYRVSGNLPPGISLRSDGHLVGVAGAAGTWTITARAIDANGNRTGSDVTVTISFSNPVVQQPPGRSVSVSKGGSAQGRPGCSSSACAYVVISFNNFGGGSHTVVCRASNDSAFYTYTTSNPTTAYCYYGYPGQTVWATVDGVESNHVRW